MDMKKYSDLAFSLLGGLLLALAFVSSVTAMGSPGEMVVSRVVREDSPVTQANPLNATTVLTPAFCRLGLGGTQRPVEEYPAELLASLRNRWFINWGFSPDYLQSVPNDLQYAPSIFVKQWKWKNDELVLVDWEAPYAVPYTYTIKPPLERLAELAAQYPGRLWLAGNEIERRDWWFEKPDGSRGSLGQGEILPEVYAEAYHEIYHTIKAADPTAKVSNGNIILPSPLRLEYLTKMWDAYYALYDAPMPVDVWQIHMYLIQEKHGDWGADIPAGSDALEGLYVFDNFTDTVLINKDFDQVPGLLHDFRTWMKDHGQQNKPLIISEFGVIMPDWILEDEFEPINVRNEFLKPGLDYLFGASDPALGYAADDYRLVQSTWWWSLDGDYGHYEGDVFFQAYNGNVLWSGLGPPNNSPYSMGLSTLGGYWVDYVSALSETVNLKPLALEPQTPVYAPTGQPVTVSLELLVSNGGHVAVTQPFSVTLTDVDTSQQLGAFTIMAPIEGCGGIYQASSVLWLDVPPGPHLVRVKVDGTGLITETNETDNNATFTIVVATNQIRLPAVLRR
jgi:hypothetical protein